MQILCWLTGHYDTVKQRRFTQPIPRQQWGFLSPYTETEKRMVWGFTTIESHCIHCGRIKIDNVLGNQTQT